VTEIGVACLACLQYDFAFQLKNALFNAFSLSKREIPL